MVGSVVNQFARGLAMMRKHDPQVQEDGFGLVKQVAAQHVGDLISAYRSESDRGLRCWLLELLGETRSPDAFPVMADALASADDSIRSWAEAGLQKMNTKEARTLLWHQKQSNA